MPAKACQPSRPEPGRDGSGCWEGITEIGVLDRSEISTESSLKFPGRREDDDMDSSDLAAFLAAARAKLASWKDQGRQLSLLLVPARIEGAVSEELYATIVRTCSALYVEIERCHEKKAALTKDEIELASEIAALEDDLRLALLEVTELSSQFYAIRSGLTGADMAIAGR